MGTKVSVFLIPFFPIVTLAAQEKSVDLNIKAFVEAPTCSVIDAELASYNYDLGRIPLADLKSMLAGEKNNGLYFPNTLIKFKCDGGAKFVNFKFEPGSRDICKSGLKSATWNFFCNEVVGGATLGIAYKFAWNDKDDKLNNINLYANRNFDEVESGIIKDGVFTLKFDNIFWAPYKDEPMLLPGPASYTMGIAVWSL